MAEETSTTSDTQPESTPASSRQSLSVQLSIIIAGLIVSGAIIYSRGGIKSTPLGGNIGTTPAPQEETVSVSADDDPTLGSPNAKIVVIEFSDFQCPFCRRLWTNVLPQLKKEFIDTGKVKFVYRDFPLSEIHPAAFMAALAAECADEQGKFWQMHDKIYGEQAEKGSGTITFTAADLKLWAQEIGLGVSAFNSCFDSEKYKDEVMKDYQDGIAAGVTGTPTVYINGRKVVGALPYETFKAIIEEELQK